MRLDLETEIRFRTGERAGVLRDVILDQNNHVSEVVMSTTGLVPRQVKVPVEALSEGEGGVLYIDLDSDQIDALPDYAEEIMPAVTGEWQFIEQAQPVAEAFPATGYEPIMPVMEVPNVPEDSITV